MAQKAARRILFLRLFAANSGVLTRPQAAELLLGGVILWLLAARPAAALTLGDNQDVADGTLSGTGGVAITRQADGKTFSWADKNGDGNPSDPATAGLDLASYDLYDYTHPGVGFILDLSTGTTNGSITWGGAAGGLIRTCPLTYEMFPGPITITNAADIFIRGFYTQRYPGGWDPGGNVTVSQSGSFQATDILTYGYTDARPSGTVIFTGGGPSAGPFQVTSNIATYGACAGSVTISGYSGVTIGFPGIDAHKDAGGTGIATVSITNIGTGGVNMPGASIRTDDTSGADGPKGNILIQTSGGISASNLITRALTNAWIRHDAGDVTLIATGNVRVVGAIDTRMQNYPQGFTGNAGDIAVTSVVGSVTLNDVLAFHASPFSGKRAGNAAITACQDLTITGSINLSYGTNSYPSQYGVLSLASTGPGSKITVKDLDCTLYRTNNWTFNAAGGKTYITGVLTNFDVATGDRIRVPPGHVVYYEPRVPGNGYLGGASYPLSSGGTLRCRPTGTVVTFR